MNLSNIFSLRVSRDWVYYLSNTNIHLYIQSSSIPQSVITHSWCPNLILTHLLLLSNAAFVKNGHTDTYQRVRLDTDLDNITSVSVLIIMSRLSTTLISRLVFNLREQSAVLAYLPTADTERGFQAGLPIQDKSMISVGNISFARPDKSAFETVTIGVAGMSR